MSNKCEIDLTVLVGDNPPPEMNMFYELFLEDANGDLIDIPVLVETLVNEAGDTPNEGNDELDYVFTRRFFIYESVSGLSEPGSYASGGATTAVRWLSQVKLVVELDESN